MDSYLFFLLAVSLTLNAGLINGLSFALAMAGIGGVIDSGKIRAVASKGASPSRRKV